MTTHEDTMREALDKFEQAIRTHCRSYGSSYSVIDGYEAKVKQFTFKSHLGF